MISNSAAVPTLAPAQVATAKADGAQFPAVAASRQIIVLDIVERSAYVAIFARFAFLTIQNLLAMPTIETFLMLVSETLPCVMILFRKPSQALSNRPTDWFFGFAGSIAPLLIKPAAVAPLLPQAICLVFILGGLFIQVAAKIVLGRCFGVIAANRGIKVAGPYRLIRHPIYAGYTLTHIGLLLTMPSLQNATLYALAFTFQVIRTLREEAVLMQSQDYRDFAARVRYRLLPGVF
jgi:protein-S-isoprenylcysteine O-methyltransferase Ste14